MEKKLAIKGHQTKGKEVIEILKMLGGKNEYNYKGKNPLLTYYVDNNREINFTEEDDLNESILRYTLEEFLEKYPYKVGDMIRVPEFESEVRINDMKWDGYNIQYEVFTDETEWYTAEELNNWNIKNLREEPKEINQNPILQQLKKYFEETPREIIEKEWNELSYLNEIGPTVEEYLESVNKYRQTQYPKTYEECCGVLKIPNDERYIDIDVPLDYNKLLSAFTELLICRNAYWKIAGEQMGLGKPWKPGFKDDSDKYFICYVKDEVWKSNIRDCNRVLVFPTEEMRDAFYENFKDKLEICKEFI